MSRYLGIDYGRAKIGLAVAESTLATPFVTLPNNRELIARIKQLCQSESITTIVCGVPEGELVAEVTTFADRLGQATGLPVKLHPETLTTQEAVAKLRAAGAKRAKLQDDHVYAAILILEDYLDQNAQVV